MNALERALIEKASYDHGFENVLGDAPADTVRMASVRHRAQVEVRLEQGAYALRILATQSSFAEELARSFPTARQADGRYLVQGEAALAALLQRAATLALALPHQALHTYAAALDAALAALPATQRGTEVERLVRQRVGQQTYRDALLDYWGGACAVTGIDLPDVLRASHAKPWADCTSDAERLDERHHIGATGTTAPKVGLARIRARHQQAQDEDVFFQLGAVERLLSAQGIGLLHG